MFVQQRVGRDGQRSTCRGACNKELDSYIDVYGSEGTVRVGWKQSKYRQASSPRLGRVRQRLRQAPGVRAARFDNFARTLRGEEKLLITGADAIASVEVIEAAYRSMRDDHWMPVKPSTNGGPSAEPRSRWPRRCACERSADVRIHPTAIVEEGVTIGSGTSVWDNVHIRGPETTIGEDCIVGEKSYIAYGVKIGDRVKINAMVYICTAVTIEDGVMISAGTIFTNDRFPARDDAGSFDAARLRARREDAADPGARGRDDRCGVHDRAGAHHRKAGRWWGWGVW